MSSTQSGQQRPGCSLLAPDEATTRSSRRRPRQGPGIYLHACLAGSCWEERHARSACISCACMWVCGPKGGRPRTYVVLYMFACVVQVQEGVPAGVESEAGLVPCLLGRRCSYVYTVAPRKATAWTAGRPAALFPAPEEQRRCREQLLLLPREQQARPAPTHAEADHGQAIHDPWPGDSAGLQETSTRPTTSRSRSRSQLPLPRAHWQLHPMR